MSLLYAILAHARFQRNTLLFSSGEIYIGEKVEGQREEAAAQGHTAGESGRQDSQESGRQDSQLAGSTATAPSSVTQCFSSRRNKYKLEVSASRYLNLQVLTNAPGEQHYIFFVFLLIQQQSEVQKVKAVAMPCS